MFPKILMKITDLRSISAKGRSSRVGSRPELGQPSLFKSQVLVPGVPLLLKLGRISHRYLKELALSERPCVCSWVPQGFLGRHFGVVSMWDSKAESRYHDPVTLRDYSVLKWDGWLEAQLFPDGVYLKTIIVVGAHMHALGGSQFCGVTSLLQSLPFLGHQLWSNSLQSKLWTLWDISPPPPLVFRFYFSASIHSFELSRYLRLFYTWPISPWHSNP